MILTNSKTFHKEGGTIKLYDYDITHLWLAGLVFANIGYWVENLFRLVSKGVLDSRNQIFPFLFCYSIAMWALYLALGTPKRHAGLRTECFMAMIKRRSCIRRYIILL